MVKPDDKLRIETRKRRDEANPQPVSHSQLLACLIHAAGGHIALDRSFVEGIPEGIGIQVEPTDDHYELKLVKLEVVEGIIQPDKRIIV